jgi:hypothetical protein
LAFFSVSEPASIDLVSAAEEDCANAGFAETIAKLATADPDPRVRLTAEAVLLGL